MKTGVGTVPLYESDGETVIGEFVITPSIIIDNSEIESLSDYDISELLGLN